ncbi:hypothetical protein N7532_002126 [Penicillium argentinense]|uniref:DNA recombination and repair protein Rad51-like C-terminal domain-containing protein n=1 Tax=Penicillium argentinense TaxID=1131581 RepID=A0A9W9G3Z9_9EURO|nr:uncharacterized protein N7532_002126 [Penicillium argentinense]KAJ5111591.1 hypothetical protein N7532_002126 [Penicillium argentinense]
MAASLGTSSLAEVHLEGLDQVLHDLANGYQSSVDYESGPLGVPALDALLEVFMLRAMKSNEPASRFLQSPAQREQNCLDDEEMLFRRGDPDSEAVMPVEPDSIQREAAFPSNVFFPDSVRRRKSTYPVVEISSSLSAAGKSQMLYFLTARMVLPRFYQNILIGGQEATVVWIDADDRFDANRLLAVARNIVQRARQTLDPDALNEDAGGPSDEDVEAVLTSALHHVHVFRPQSSSSVLATLQNLDSYLYDLSRHSSASRSLQMVAIDSATAFYWQDRLRDETARTEEIGRSRAEVDREREKKQSFYLSDVYAEMVSELKRLQGRFRCAVVYTTTVAGGRPANSSSSSEPGGRYCRAPALKPALPAPWGTFPILRLVVHRDAVRSFPPASSTQDVKRDAPTRQSIINQGKFSAWVNSWDREEWPRRVADGVDWYNGGSFPFYVRESGIEIPPPDR